MTRFASTLRDAKAKLEALGTTGVHDVEKVLREVAKDCEKLYHRAQDHIRFGHTGTQHMSTELPEPVIAKTDPPVAEPKTDPPVAEPKTDPPVAEPEVTKSEASSSDLIDIV